MVLAVLAAVSGLVVSSLSGMQEQAQSDIDKHTLSEVRRAILQFKADTGYLPKRGPFNLHPDDVDLSTQPTRVEDQGRVRLANLPITAVVTDEDKRAWFDAPANLWQLFECPLPATDPLSRWDPARRRGWRGPYLTRAGQGWVSVRAGLVTDGFGEWPAAAPFSMLQPFPAVANAHPHQSQPGGRGFVWTLWGHEDPVSSSMGRPLLVFDLDPGPPGPQGDAVLAQRARVVSLGPDGEYTKIDDLSRCVSDLGDDEGVYLLR